MTDPVIVDELYSNSTDQYRCHAGSQHAPRSRLQSAV